MYYSIFKFIDNFIKIIGIKHIIKQEITSKKLMIRHDEDKDRDRDKEIMQSVDDFEILEPIKLFHIYIDDAIKYTNKPFIKLMRYELTGSSVDYFLALNNSETYMTKITIEKYGDIAHIKFNKNIYTLNNNILYGKSDDILVHFRKKPMVIYTI